MQSPIQRLLIFLCIYYKVALKKTNPQQENVLILTCIWGKFLSKAAKTSIGFHKTTAIVSFFLRSLFFQEHDLTLLQQLGFLSRRYYLWKPCCTPLTLSKLSEPASTQTQLGSPWKRRAAVAYFQNCADSTFPRGRLLYSETGVLRIARFFADQNVYTCALVCKKAHINYNSRFAHEYLLTKHLLGNTWGRNTISFKH